MAIPILEQFIKQHNLDGDKLSVVTTKDMDQLKSYGYSVEDLLNHLVKVNKTLLHGSREYIMSGFLKPNKQGLVYATDLPSIALMRSLIANNNPDESITNYQNMVKNNRLRIRIHNITDKTIANEGCVYIINNREGFIKSSHSSREYVKEGFDVTYNSKIAVSREDFKQPIFDVTNNIQIQ